MSWRDGLEGVFLEIASTPDSPLRVMAGPGTGKSFAMKRRVARLLEADVDPRRILAVTFTRNAAGSLINDLHALGIDGCDRIRAGTVHSLCFSLLNRQDVFEYLGRVPRPLVTFNKSAVLQFEGRALLEDIMGCGPFGAKRNCTKRIRAFEAAWARLQSDTPGWPTDPTDRAFHDELRSWLRFHRAILIGELVPEALRFLRNNPASEARTAFDHVIVDEYQDLNRAEQELIDLLACSCAKAVVGDVDQSIYRFRHANPEGIEEFSESHPGTHDEELIECRRCPTRVVSIADCLIRNNHPEEDVARLLPKNDNPPGEVHIVQWDTMDNEAQGLADYVKRLIDDRGFTSGQILVLTPRRLIGYGIRDCLRKADVSVHSFYHEEALEEEEAQRAFALLSLLVNNEDRVALRWWLGHDSPTFRSGAYRRLRECCAREDVSTWAALSALDEGGLSLSGVKALVSSFHELQELLSTLDSSNLEALVDELFPAQSEHCSVLREAALLALPRVESVAELLDSLKIIVTQPEIPEEGNFVRVMSLHKSKGLTSDVVVVAGCIQGLIPFVDKDQSAAEQEAVLKEQRRLFYVAVTRCRQILVLSSVANMERSLAWKIKANMVRGAGAVGRTIASKFLDELGPTAPASKAGRDWQAANYA